MNVKVAIESIQSEAKDQGEKKNRASVLCGKILTDSVIKILKGKIEGWKKIFEEIMAKFPKFDKNYRPTDTRVQWIPRVNIHAERFSAMLQMLKISNRKLQNSQRKRDILSTDKGTKRITTELSSPKMPDWSKMAPHLLKIELSS